MTKLGSLLRDLGPEAFNEANQVIDDWLDELDKQQPETIDHNWALFTSKLADSIYEVIIKYQSKGV